MSTSIGTLAVMVSANSMGFTAGMAAAQKSAVSFGATMSHMAKTAGALVGIGAIGDVIGKAWKGFTGAEDSRLTFEALTGSASVAKKLKEELKDWGDMTPFGDGVGTAAKQLLKFNYDADAVLPTLKMFGEVAAGVHVPLEELTSLIAENGFRANIGAKQLKALADLGAPLMQELIQATGLSQSAIVEMANQGGIKFEHLMAAMKSATSEGGRFFGMTERRANTTANLLSRITDQAGDVVGKLGSVLGDRLSSMFGTKGGLRVIFDWLQRVEEGVKELGPWFDNVILVFQTVKDVAGSAWEGFSQIVSIGFGYIGEGVDAFGNKIGGFRETFIDAMLSVRFVFNNFSEFVLLGFGKLSLKAWGFSNDMVHFFTVTIPEAFQYFASQAVKILDYVADYAKHAFKSFAAGFEGGFLEIQLGLSTIGEKIGLSDNATSKKIFDKLVESDRQRMAMQAPVFQPFDKMGKFTERQLSDAEKGMKANLDAMANRLAVGKEKFFANEKARLNADNSPGFWKTLFGDMADEAKKRSGRVGGFGDLAGKKDEWKRSGAIEAGSKEAYNVILKSRDFNGPQQQTASNTAKLVKVAEKQQATLESMDDKLDVDTDFVEDFGGGASF